MAEIRHAVVTGPTGAVGVALINELIRAGAKVTAVCNPRSRRTAHIPSYGGVNIVYCDASDYVHLPLLVDRKTDAFFHLAWTGTYGSARQDYEMQARNVEYSTAAAMAAKTLGCDVFIGAGSQAECGNTEGALTPNTVCDPETAYGAAKLAAMYTTRTYCKSEGMRHVWCRIVSLFGPGDRPYTTDLIR